MALNTQFIVGCRVRDELAYLASASANVSMETVPATPWGGYHMKCTTASSIALYAGSPVDAAANDTYVWRMGFFLFESIPSGANRGVYLCSVSGGGISAIHVDILEDGAGNNNIRIRDNLAVTLGTGSTDLSTNAWHMIIIRFDGTNIKVWVNGTLEITVAGAKGAAKPDDQDCNKSSSSGGGGPDHMAHWCGVTSATATDIDETADYSEVRAIFPSADGNYGQWGDNADETSIDGTYTDWDDWASGAVDEATYIAGQNSVQGISDISVANPTVITTGSAHSLTTGQSVTISGSNSTPSIDGEWVVTVLSSTTFSIPTEVTGAGSAGTATILLRESSVMDNETFTNGMVSVALIARMKATAAAKNVNVSALLRESSTDAESSVTDAPSGTAFSPQTYIFDAAPSGAWNQTRFDALEAGIRRDGGTDGANVYAAALAVEGLAIGSTAPPAAGTGFVPQAIIC